MGAAVALGGFTAAAVSIDRFGQHPPPHRAPAIVVLGARVYPGGVPSDALRARVDAAVGLYRQQVAPLLVFSGGVGEHPPSEAQVMRRLAREAGVPEAACLVEERSHSTFDNARFTAELLRARGIDEVVVVSDPYHLYRARQHFRRQGIDAWPWPASMSARNLSWPQRAYWTAREVVALVRRPWLLLARRPEVHR